MTKTSIRLLYAITTVLVAERDLYMTENFKKKNPRGEQNSGDILVN